MSLHIGVCGAGAFASSFIPLFQAHPLVGEVSLAEVFPERRAEQAARFGVRQTYASLNELCASSVDGIALFTQRWLHGPQALQALRAGKHVYSAVPAGVTLDELGALVQAVEETRLIYMMGETSYYYPTCVYCRERYRRGDFGRFVYGEGEYLHDMSHGFYEAYQHSGGEQWKQTAGFPPMLYPTHSTSMILAVTGARMTQVSCLGFRDQHEDGIFTPEGNLWRNIYSNETALFRTSDGGMARINEFRRVGHHGRRSVRLSLFGGEACFEEQADHDVWVTRDRQMIDVTDQLTCRTYTPDDLDKMRREGVQSDFFSGLAPVHHRERLPKEFWGLRNGHLGSHQFLVDDFLRGVAETKLPPNHVWAAARYTAPGIVAHQSAEQEGALLPIPDLGEAPSHWGRLEVE
jgi:predicted dehydrogenase